MLNLITHLLNIKAKIMLVDTSGLNLLIFWPPKIANKGLRIIPLRLKSTKSVVVDMQFVLSF